jgi:peroxiredoxin
MIHSNLKLTRVAAMAAGVLIMAFGIAAAAAPGAGGVGAFTDTTGKTYTTNFTAEHPATVFVFLSTQCPVSNLYSSRLNSLAKAFAAQNVPLIGVFSDRQENLQEVKKNAAQHHLAFPVVKDERNVIADRLHATLTPQAIVVDAHNVVRYMGRIDDNSVATRVTSNDLASAVRTVLANGTVTHPVLNAVGCIIRRAGATQAAIKPGVPTYASDVAPILRTRCEGCHHEGEVAPFSLTNYAQASAWAADIKRYTQNRQMPPWKPAPGYGEFKEAHNRMLSDHELDLIARWADAGAPQGRPEAAPAPNHFAKGWRLGEPDLVIQPEKEFHLGADGEDVYRNFVVKTNFAEDRYISGVEVRPGNPSVVHHVIAYIDGIPTSGGYSSDKLDGREHDGQPGFTSFGGPGFNPSGMLSGWAPGNDPTLLPDGVANLVQKGARIVIQVHYHKDGKPETDLTKIGIHFCKSTVDKIVTGGVSINFAFQIPPGAEHYEARGMWVTNINSGRPDFAQQTLTSDQHILAVTPHMHLLGKEMRVWATLPDGTEKPLVWIKDWDFNWQMTYFLKEPIAAPKGTKINMVAYYDNSAKNPRNPNRQHPLKVGWGESTTDEMCIAFVTTTKDSEHLAINPNKKASTRATASR